MKPEEVVSNAKLQRIAEANPASLRELQLVGDFPDLWMAAFGKDVLTALRDT